MPRQRSRVNGEQGQIVEYLLILQIWQRACLVDRPLAQPARRAARQARQNNDEHGGPVAHVGCPDRNHARQILDGCRDYIGSECQPA